MSTIDSEKRVSQLDTSGELAEDTRCNLRTRGYLPIENYGMIGNLRTVALSGTDGSIDFFCYPKFDSPSIFARLLDNEKGGHFSITPSIHSSNKQQYLPRSNILLTRFLHDEGVSEVTDYMHLPDNSGPAIKPLLPWLIRHVRVVRGKVDFHFELFPSFNYALDDHTVDIEDYKVTANDDKSFVGKKRFIFRSKTINLDFRYVVTKADQDPPVIDFKLIKKNEMKGPGICSKFQLKESQEITFILRELPSVGIENQLLMDPPLNSILMKSLYKQTLAYWQKWISQSCYKGRWRENVHRSALTLKLLTYEPTGAVVASPTFGLPEGKISEIGGPRNWDYRYTWIRDSAFTVYALMRLGMIQETERYMKYMEERCQDLNPDGSLNIMYSIDGEKKLTEVELTHLDGYRSSKPVRIGNGAYDHLQLDIYGELLDAVYLYNKYGSPLSYDMWQSIRKLVNYVCDNWGKEDMSIWEVRGKKQNFTYSKIMCWVAVDRGIRLSEKRVLPCPDRDRWMKVRDNIYEEVMTKAWNPEQKFFAQSYEALDALDSSVLIMPLVFFISPNDPRFLSTVRQILLPPEKGGLLANNLAFRYNYETTDDGFDGGVEGSFSMCTFWLVEALTRAGKYDKKLLGKAEFIFEQMISYGNHLGLYSEEIASSGELLGNFPQAFTHLAFISAAFNLDRVLG